MLASVRVASSLALLVTLMAASATSRAAPEPATPSVESSSLAERLFQDGRRLVEAGDHEGACAKFEASWKIDPRAVGTLLNIAQCKEATGKLATAWGLYREVAQRSRGTRPDRVEVAEKKERELGDRLSSLTLTVPKDAPADLALRVDGLLLDRGAWSSALPADPGEHTLEASAPGYTTATVKATVRGDRQRVPLVVPKLERAPVAKVTAPPSETTPPSRGTRNLGLVLTGVGVVTLGVGAYLGVDVLARADQPKELCPAPCVRTSTAGQDSQARYDALDRQALVANIVLPVGGVLTLAGAYLWLVAGSSSAPKKTGSTRFVFGPGSAGVAGTF